FYAAAGMQFQSARYTSASGRSRGNPKLKNHSTGMPEIARMAASLVACLARPNRAPHSLPYERFRAFACVFHI
ncbi:hypothetical protein, partial [Burkholderia cenocepacia]|uniref:hypothetical protein n=1 Tax=Burkholderia cenocepacia TaxID=95486 RepID=UPI001CF2A35A